MSTFDSDDLETMGYFLPEDSRFRLKKLREYVEFLSHVAQPRIWDEDLEGVPKIRVGEVAICLELLAEQLGLVLDDISCPAERREREATAGGDAEPEATDEVPNEVGKPYLFGMTLEQVDRLNQLIDMISAHGDVVIASDDAEFARHTLPLLGDAICCDVGTMREIIDQVESQRLEPARGSQTTGVGEEWAIYRAGPSRLPVGSELHFAGSVVASLPGGGERVGCRSASWLGFDHVGEAILDYH